MPQEAAGAIHVAHLAPVLVLNLSGVLYVYCRKDSAYCNITFPNSLFRSYCLLRPEEATVDFYYSLISPDYSNYFYHTISGRLALNHRRFQKQPSLHAQWSVISACPTPISRGKRPLTGKFSPYGISPLFTEGWPDREAIFFPETDARWLQAFRRTVRLIPYCISHSTFSASIQSRAPTLTLNSTTGLTTTRIFTSVGTLCLGHLDNGRIKSEAKV